MRIPPLIVDLVNTGQSYFREPDLDMLLSAAVQTLRLRAQTTPAEAKFFIIAVPTPFRDGHKPDMSHVEAAAHAIAPLLRPGDTIILEGTSPVGTTELLASLIKAARPELTTPTHGAPAPDGCIHFVHCPERILSGTTKDCARRAPGLY